MTRDEVRTLLAHAAATTRDWAPTTVDVDVWLALLGHTSYDDALTALHQHAATTHHRPVPADLLAGVRRLRADRLDRVPHAVPAADPDDVPRWLADLRAQRHRAAGQRALSPDRRELTGVFRTVPAASAAAIEAAQDAVRRIPRRPTEEAQ